MPSKTQTPPHPAPVKELVKKNLRAVAEIEESADDLAVVHAVLKTDLKAVKASEDAQRAVEQTREVKAKLEATAAELQKATKALQQQSDKK